MAVELLCMIAVNFYAETDKKYKMIYCRASPGSGEEEGLDLSLTHCV